MRKKKQSKFPAKYVLLIMTILCAVIIGCSLKTSGSGPVSAAAGAVLAPMQKGVNQLGSGLTNLREHLRTKKSLEKENEELRTQLADAQQNLNQVQLNQEELDNLKSLYDMIRIMPIMIKLPQMSLERMQETGFLYFSSTGEAMMVLR